MQLKLSLRGSAQQILGDLPLEEGEKNFHAEKFADQEI